MSSSIVIALDGPSGSGKSSTARGVAERLGLRYLDTGAQFRAVTVWMLDHRVDVHDAVAVAADAARPRIESGTDPSEPTIVLDGRDVAARIRSAEVTAAVSPVATVAEVRKVLLDLQRSIIAEARSTRGIVVEGRDIGSVVAPDAEVKLYLTADPAARATRRTAENGAADVHATEAALLRRDAIDSARKTAPLTVPEGATHIDTTWFTLEEVIAQVVAIAEKVTGGESVGR